MERVPESQAIAEMQDARRFNQVMGGNRFRQQEYRQLASDLCALGVPAGGKVLDVGTGTGYVALAVARQIRERGGHVVGLELSDAMLTMAAENAAGAGVDGTVAWRKGDAKAMPFADAEFDAVVSLDSLHHWESPPRVFDEIARVLKPAGKCIVRDSKRLQKWWLWLLVKTLSLSIPRDFRVHWWNSIKSSYTKSELESILARSRLRGWRVEQDLMGLSVIKEG